MSICHACNARVGCFDARIKCFHVFHILSALKTAIKIILSFIDFHAPLKAVSR